MFQIWFKNKIYQKGELAEPVEDVVVSEVGDTCADLNSVYVF